MNQERWYFWKKGRQEDAGGKELERSESSFSPASRPAAEGPVVSLGEPNAADHLVVKATADVQPVVAEVPLVDTELVADGVSVIGELREDVSAVGAGAQFGLMTERDEPLEVDSRPTELPEEKDADLQPAGQPEDEGEDGADVNDLLEWEDDPPPTSLNLAARKRGTLSKPSERPKMPLSPTQKLLLLDTWARSGLPARDFGALVNVSRHTLYSWKHRFEQLGPAGLMEQPRGVKSGSRLPELTKRTILMLKQAHPDWGCQRISDMLVRGPALPASPTAVARILHEAGYEMQEVATHAHAPPVHSFERAMPNQLWQTDLFTFMLKRQNRRVYLVAFMDDHSRFITGYGLHATQSAALVIEVLRAALAAYGVPGEILTDNGSQYITWRGKSQFSRELEKRGIKQIVARPRRPQTLGKIERFWGSLWRECVETSVFLDLADARQRIGLYIDHYNLQRPHQGLGGLVPADRFFSAAPEVLKTLKERVAANALELARHGVPKKPFYLTGQVDGKPFSVHQEGDRVILRQADQLREEIDLVDPAEGEVTRAQEAEVDALPRSLCPDGSPTSLWQVSTSDTSLPGVSPLDELLRADVSAEPPSADDSSPHDDEPPPALGATGGDT
jgi:transposase InsO family protein